MKSKAAKILLTGLPGCGKTTAVMQIVANLNNTKMAGFYTKEIRENNIRKGFSWTLLDGATGTLANTEFKSPHKVGKYYVDIAGFEKSVIPTLDINHGNAELFIIDEIGKMECFSKKFITAVRQLFESDKSVLATIARQGGGFISEAKNFPDTKLFNMTAQNRNNTITEILQILTELGTNNE